MDRMKSLELLYQYAAEHLFDKFDMLFSELETTLSFEQFWEAYLMRAQIKLFVADPSVVDDLTAIDQVDDLPRFACLNTVWEADAPNRFIMYSKEPGLLRRFMGALLQVRNKMSRWYATMGDIMVRQVQCDLLYWTGDVRESLALANEPLCMDLGTYTDIFLLLCAQFRCYLALGESEAAEQCMMELIRMSKRYPECVAPYQAFRGWANITTSWNGDTPRFSQDESGKQQPVFDDRLDDIRKGSARITPLEAVFASFAEHHYDGVYTLRQYYIDVFHGMYWLLVGDKKLAEACAQKIYDIATTTGLIMPIVECGAQIMPLLRHVKRQGMEFSAEWLAKISTMAQAYENALEQYCEINA